MLDLMRQKRTSCIYIMKRTQLYLDDAQHEQAGRLAMETGVTLSDVVRAALAEYLERRRRHRMEFLGALDRASGIWRQRHDLPSEFPGSRKPT